MQNRIRHLTIVGGGTAGWMTAAALAKFFGKNLNITLVESVEIGTVGVGESTIPQIRHFNDFLGIDERDFMGKTGATYKLGIQFLNWGRIGEEYIHPFGSIGTEINGIEFHHYWLRMRALGDMTPIDHYSLAAVAARKGRFSYPDTDLSSIGSTFNYSYHLDAVRYAKYLREFSESRGVKRIEGKVQNVSLDSDSGNIESVILADGQELRGDFFIDCTGFRSLLLNGSLKVGFDDWRHWLPCDRAVAVACERKGKLGAYTQAKAQSAGWQWRIPLQHRCGNGHVYASEHMSDDQACSMLLNSLEGEAIGQPKSFKFTAGKMKSTWFKNCVAIGLSGGFLEPLESTSIYLIQVGIFKLLDFFPSLTFSRANTDEFNRQVDIEYIKIRDFIILHYSATSRDDTSFWRYCRNMNVPDGLKYRQQLFVESAHVDHNQYGVGVALCMGQGVIPNNFDSRVNNINSEQLKRHLSGLKNTIEMAAEKMQTTEKFIEMLLSR